MIIAFGLIYFYDMEKHQISTGILSYGMSGRLFQAPYLATNPGFILRAVVERHQKTASLDYPGIISYDDIGQLLHDPEIELVVVNTPNGLHFEHAMAALKAGKHVLLEKPATVNVEEYRKLRSLAEEMRRHLFVYQNRRWDSDFNSVRSVVNSGILGQLSEVHFRYDHLRPDYKPKGMSGEQVPAGSGAAYDFGPHLLDQVIALFGEPARHLKFTHSSHGWPSAPDFFNFHLMFEDGKHVFVSANLGAIDEQAAFVLHGSKGSFVKHRSDVQGGQLSSGIKPGTPGFGVEEDHDAGILTTLDVNGTKVRELVPAQPSSYQGIFDAIHAQIVYDTPFPVTHEQIEWQIRLLEEPDALPVL